MMKDIFQLDQILQKSDGICSENDAQDSNVINLCELIIKKIYYGIRYEMSRQLNPIQFTFLMGQAVLRLMIITIKLAPVIYTRAPGAAQGTPFITCN